MSGFLQDLHYALRTLRREKSFFVFAALIIGIGVGANTAVFSVMSPILLRPLPFREPDRLVWVALQKNGGMSSVTSRTSNLRDYRAMNRSFDGLTGYFAFFEYNSYNLSGDGEPERLVGVGVAQDFLEVLGVSPLLGLNFVEEEAIWDGRPAAILTHGFRWGSSWSPPRRGTCRLDELHGRILWKPCGADEGGSQIRCRGQYLQLLRSAPRG